MHAGENYSLREVLWWTRRDILILAILASVPTVLYMVADMTWLGIPWVLLAMVGTSTAFLIGFRNTQTYNRLWEARQIWGAIVNTSRTWSMLVRDYLPGRPELHRELVYRHLAWLTCLRYQLREPRVWESTMRPNMREYMSRFQIEEHHVPLEQTLRKYLTEKEVTWLLARKNRAAQLIARQSATLSRLHAEGVIDTVLLAELEGQLALLYEHQGKCERIKNFPYPRQFSTINVIMVWIFVLLLPLGVLNELGKMGSYYPWLTIPFSALIGWVFTTMERVGQSSENPFEGSANDVPISAMSRGIEIDLRDMLGEAELPPAHAPLHRILL